MHHPKGMSIVHRLFGVITAAVMVFLYVPIVLLVIFSFNKSDLNIRWTGATAQHYADLIHNQQLMLAFRNSIALALAVTAVSVFLGTAGAWLAHRYRFPGGRGIWGLIYLPILMPDIIMGVSLLVLFVTLFKPLNHWCIQHHWPAEFKLGWTTLLLAHVTFCFPFVMVAVQSRLSGLDPSLEEAALDLGARPSQAFFLVVLPQLLPAVVSGALMSFTLSMDEFIVTSFTKGPESVTLPIVIFSMARIKPDAILNAASAVFIVGTALLMGMAEYLRRPGTPAAGLL